MSHSQNIIDLRYIKVIYLYKSLIKDNKTSKRPTDYTNLEQLCSWKSSQGKIMNYAYVISLKLKIS